MSKRLQVIMPEAEYKLLHSAAKRSRCTVAGLVRASLRETLAAKPQRPPQERLLAILRFAKASGPTADIEEMLAEIDRGFLSS